MILQVIFKDKNSHNAGFTIIELLIVIGISLTVLAASVPIYGNIQGTAQINYVTSEMIQTIRTARERSINRLNNSSHGVYFDINPTGDDSYILYQGSSYDTRDSEYDRTIDISGVLSLSTIITSNEINFSKGIGEPNNVGEITISHETQESKTIAIDGIGIVDQN